jgi:hypothetical protein
VVEEAIEGWERDRPVDEEATDGDVISPIFEF